MEQTPVHLAGVGLLTPLGQSAWETFRALLSGQTLGDRAQGMPEDVALLDRVKAVGCVKTAQHSLTDVTVTLAEKVAREACDAAGIDARGLPCFVGTSKGAIGALTALASGSRAVPDAALAVALGPQGYLAHHLAQRLKLKVKRVEVAACASGLIALDAARRYVQRGDAADTAVVVTADSAMLPMFVHAYQRLGVLAPETDYRGASLCGQRHGFMLAEQAAAVVIKRGEGEIQLLDTASLTDPHDLIRSDETMRTLRQIAERFAEHGPLTMLQPHAPGTASHDAAEAAVLEDVFGGVPAYGAKGALGHGLGSSGLVSVALSALMLRSGIRPGMPWLDGILSTGLGLHPGKGATPRDGKHAVFAAGFGGHVAGALLGI